jgi:hypothetical protein
MARRLDGTRLATSASLAAATHDGRELRLGGCADASTIQPDDLGPAEMAHAAALIAARRTTLMPH